MTSFSTPGKEILPSLWPEKGVISLALAASLPLALPGYLSHFLPTFFTDKITKAINSDIHWVPTFKYTAGVVFYPLFLWLQVWLVGKLAFEFGLGAWVKWAYLAAFFPLGLVAEWWLKTWRRWQQGRRAAALRSGKKTEWAALHELRQKAVRQLEGLLKPAST